MQAIADDYASAPKIKQHPMSLSDNDTATS
jgi:hypothetical protein